MIEKTEVLRQHLSALAEMPTEQRRAVLRELRAYRLRAQAGSRGVGLSRAEAIGTICDLEASDLNAGREVDVSQLHVLDVSEVAALEPSPDGS